jgi:putative ABC transport system permease protein
MRPPVPTLNRPPGPLMAESVRVAWSTRVVSGLVFILGLAVPASVLGVTGLNIEAQAAILARVDDVGARTLTIVSSSAGPVIPSSAVERIVRLDGVAWVVGLGPFFDVRTRRTAGGPTPVRAYRAAGAPVVFSGTPVAGRAYLSETSTRRVGLGGVYSTLDPGGLQVAGWFHTSEPLTALEPFILLPSEDDSLRLERVIVAVRDVGWTETVATRLGAMIGADAAASTSIERSPELLEARGAVRDETGRRDRMLVVALLVVAMGLVGVVVSAGTIAASRDFGRRRALGATRGQLMALVILTTLWPATLGTLAGSMLGVLYLGSRIGAVPDWRFPAAVGIMSVLALVAASALPAAAAATRDPLRVLRVP